MLAPFYKRLLNWIADNIFISILFFFAMTLGNYLADTYGYQFLKVGKPQLGVDNYRFSFLYSAISVVYYGLFESYFQRTPGKFITVTRVIRFDHNTPTEWNILFRSLLRQIPLEVISFIGPLPVGLHDSLSKTLVVDIYKYQKEALKQQQRKAGTTPEEF